MRFKCKHTGNVYTFTNPADVKQMKQHSDYEMLDKDENEDDIADEVVRRKRQPKKAAEE